MNKQPPIQKTEPEVFILESLDFDDENESRFEGRILADVLRMCGKNPKYYYFRTEAELEILTLMFRESGYRYLHLSCHGSSDKIHTTLNDITYIRFSQIFEKNLRNRRLFVSACEVGNELFSAVVAGRNKGMYSIAGPSEDIRFDHAVAFWSAFYVKAFSVDSGAMKGGDIESALQDLCKLFAINFFFSKYNAKKDKWINKDISGR
ncbi:MAG: hypothetical protein ACOY3E_13630 [Pseudomonadota bacterium]